MGIGQCDRFRMVFWINRDSKFKNGHWCELIQGTSARGQNGGVQMAECRQMASARQVVPRSKGVDGRDKESQQRFSV